MIVTVLTDGVQSRSRVILVHAADCPDELIQNRHCPSTVDCPRYSWNTSAWVGNRRDVWCQDNDGHVVYGVIDRSATHA